MIDEEYKKDQLEKFQAIMNSSNRIEEKMIKSGQEIAAHWEEVSKIEEGLIPQNIDFNKKISKEELINIIKTDTRYSDENLYDVIGFINAYSAFCEEKHPNTKDKVSKKFYKTPTITKYKQLLNDYATLKEKNMLLGIAMSYTRENNFKEFKIKTGKDLTTLLYKTDAEFFQNIDMLKQNVSSETSKIALLLFKNMLNLADIENSLEGFKSKLFQYGNVMHNSEGNEKHIFSVNLTSLKGLSPVEIMAVVGHEYTHLVQKDDNKEIFPYYNIMKDETKKREAWWMDEIEAEADKGGYSLVRQFMKENNIKIFDLPQKELKSLIGLKQKNFKHVLSMKNPYKVKLMEKQKKEALDEFVKDCNDFIAREPQENKVYTEEVRTDVNITSNEDEKL